METMITMIFGFVLLGWIISLGITVKHLEKQLDATREKLLNQTLLLDKVHGWTKLHEVLHKIDVKHHEELLDIHTKNIENLYTFHRNALLLIQKTNHRISNPLPEEALKIIESNLIASAKEGKESAEGLIRFSLNMSLAALMAAGPIGLVDKLRKATDVSVVKDWELN